MSIVIWFNCDQPVPDGVCGEKTFALADAVPAAVSRVEREGWYVGGVQANGRRRVACPGHGGRRQR